MFGLFDLWFDMVVHPLWNIFSFFRVCLWNIFSAFPKRPSKYCYHDSRDLVAAGSQRCIEKGPPRPGPNALKHACMADWSFQPGRGNLTFLISHILNYSTLKRHRQNSCPRLSANAISEMLLLQSSICTCKHVHIQIWRHRYKSAFWISRDQIQSWDLLSDQDCLPGLGAALIACCWAKIWGSHEIGWWVVNHAECSEPYLWRIILHSIIPLYHIFFML